jgi:hypothetical protein
VLLFSYEICYMHFANKFWCAWWKWCVMKMVRDENGQMDQRPIFGIFVLCKVLF